MRQPNSFRRRFLIAIALLAAFLLAALIGYLFTTALLGTTYTIDPGPAIGPV